VQTELQTTDARIATIRAACHQLAGFIARPYRDHADQRLQLLGLGLLPGNNR